jgi:mannonate dehydratase
MSDVLANRREFGRALLGGTALLAATPAKERLLDAPTSPGIKLSLQVNDKFTDDDLNFAKQLGLDYITIETDNVNDYNAFVGMKRRVEAAGLGVTNIRNRDLFDMPEVTLNLPGRDQRIEEYKQYLRNLGRAGVSLALYAHMGNGIWESPQEPTRGGALTRAFHMGTAKGYWVGKVYELPLTNGRKYSEEEMWENYTYFIKQIAPVAEEAGVRIGIHPDDPPVPDLGGVPRCIFGNYDGYVRALKIANSPNIGVCLCCGTWAEGGEPMGKNVYEAVRAFAGMGVLWKIHFRNVSSPVPDFIETFVDGGYTDMKKLMRTLVDVDYGGVLIADHAPQMIGDQPSSGRIGKFAHRSAWAFSVGYIRGLYDMAREEKARGVKLV